MASELPHIVRPPDTTPKALFGGGLAWVVFWPLFKLIAPELIRLILPSILDRAEYCKAQNQQFEITDQEIQAALENSHDELRYRYHRRRGQL